MSKKGIVLDKVWQNKPMLGLQSVHEPLHMVYGIISPCDHCNNDHCIRKNPDAYKEYSEEFWKLMNYDADGNLLSSIFGEDHNPIAFEDEAFKGMAFAFVALAYKNIYFDNPGWFKRMFRGIGAKAMFTWDFDTEYIVCEPFPVPFAFHEKHVNSTFSKELKQKNWITIIYPGENVHNGIFFPTGMYGDGDEDMLANAYKDYEIVSYV